MTDKYAFPVTGLSTGLTKREYFAAMAMHGMLAGGAHDKMYKEVLADLSIQYADELLKQLEQ